MLKVSISHNFGNFMPIQKKSLMQVFSWTLTSICLEFDNREYERLENTRSFLIPHTNLQLHHYELDALFVCVFLLLLFVCLSLHSIAVACVGWDTCCKFLWKPNLKVLRTKTDEFPSNIRFHNFYCGIKVLQIMGIPHSSNMLQFSSTLSVHVHWPKGNFPMHKIVI